MLDRKITALFDVINQNTTEITEDKLVKVPEKNPKKPLLFS